MRAYPLLLLLVGLFATRLPARRGAHGRRAAGAPRRPAHAPQGGTGEHRGRGYRFLDAEDLPSGTRVPRHRHELDEEILIVQRGEVTVELNDSAHAAPGEAPRRRTPQEEAEERRACQMTYRTHAH